MSDKYRTAWFYASLENEVVEKGLVLKSKSKVYNHRQVDVDEYARLLQRQCNELDDAGYDVFSIVPIVMGTAEKFSQKDGTYVGDVGFSISRGAVVVGKRREQ